MRLLVTGSSGFVGSHVLAAFPSAITLDYKDGINLLNAVQLEEKINSAQFDIVIHLAAQSFVPEAFKDPMTTFDINFKGTYNLLCALKKAKFQGRFLYVSTGDVYGLLTPDLLPVTEKTNLRPGNPYAVSKVAAEALCFQWSLSAGFEIVIARPFNHIGPGQAAYFAISDFAKQIAEIKLGKREPVLRVGDIDVTRDFTDVRDIVRAYFLLLEKGDNGEIYNVCSEIERSIRNILEQLIELSGIKVEIVKDNERFRSVDQKRVVGCCAKLRRVTGWEPELKFTQTLQEILLYWLERLS